MASLEERVSRLEGGQEHLATKADLANTKVEIIKWVVGVGIGVGVGVVTLTSSVILVALRIMN